jgi:hypothetical protein
VLFAAIAAASCRHHAAAPSGAAAHDAEAIALPSRAGTPCGALDCRQYDSLEEAFESVLGGGARVVAVGEAHAQKGTTVPSAARHFTEEVLPHLAGRASDLLVELMNPPAGCAPTTEVVRKQQAVVTQVQAPTDQGEYVAMGERARQLGIVPDLLRPTCADLDAVKAAGDDAVVASLSLIARLTRVQAEKLIDRDARTPGEEGRFVVTYGGAIHNDPDPPSERASFSFGADLTSYAGGRYVAVDLYVPELIDGSDLWKKLPFYAHYDPARLGAKTTVFRQGRKFVIVLARTGAK